MVQGLEELFIVPTSRNEGTAEEKVLAPYREVLYHNYTFYRREISLSLEGLHVS